MPEHVHVHAPHELADGADGHVSGRERVFELGAVLLLSFATVCIAWMPVRVTVLVLATCFLTYGAAQLASLPTL